ncbi:MAG: FlgD immunoglobulin-like domain containing protein, partial [Candidatus Margulisiibacteriota bacterium]
GTPINFTGSSSYIVENTIGTYRDGNPAYDRYGELANPYSICLDSSDNIYAADTYGERIRKYNPSGERQLTVNNNNSLKIPMGICVNDSGEFYIADAARNKIFKQDQAGNMIKSFGKMGPDEKDLFSPRKMLLVQNGVSQLLYLADYNNNKILVFDVTDVVDNVVLNNEYISPNGDGKKDSASISFRLNYSANLKAEIVDINGNSLAVLYDAARDTGEVTINWNGSINGNPASDGEYRFKISGSVQGRAFYPVLRNVYIDTLPPVFSIVLNNKTVSPNNDGIKDKFELTYYLTDSLSKMVKDLRIDISKKLNDGSAQLIYTMANKTTQSVPTSNESLTWEAKINDYISEGEYIVTANAYDQAENRALENIAFYIDVSAPVIDNLNLYPGLFSPNNDGKKDSTTFEFNLSDKNNRYVDVTVKVRDSLGTEVSILKDKITMSLGTQQITWDGKDASQAVVPDGEYKLKVFAVDDGGNMNMAAKSIVIDTMPPGINTFTSDPNPFTPNNDGIKEKTTFSYSLSENSTNNIMIYDKNNSLFRKNQQYNQKSGTWGWDGRGSQGELVGGSYNCYLQAEDQAGNIATSSAESVLVDIEPSLIAYAYATPDPFSPVNPLNAFTNVNYYVSRDNTRVQITVYGAQNKAIKNLVFGELKNKGEHSVKWYGDYLPGYQGPLAVKDTNKVADGSYMFKVLAQDFDGGSTTEVTNTVLVDNVPPSIYCYPVNVNYASQEASFAYSIPENATVDVSVYDLDGKIVKNIFSGYQNPGTYYSSYKPLSADETGYFKVTAEDNAKNKDEKNTEVVTFKALSAMSNISHSVSPAVITPNGDS